MKVLQIHNKSRGGGGADYVYDETVGLLHRKSVKVSTIVRSSNEIGMSFKERLNAFACGIHSQSVCSLTCELIKKERPNIVHVHELYPLLSSALRSCGRADLPVVMTVHNFRLICPTYVCSRHGKTCDQCWDGKEYWCFLNNCRGNLAESFVFAMHHMVARKFRLFKDNVTLYIAPSDFAKKFLINHSIDKSKIRVLPHMVRLPASNENRGIGRYVAYSGRFAQEKGIHILVAAAKHLPHIQFYFTGNPTHMICTIKHIPNNIKFVGWLNAPQLADFYRNARFIVIPSIYYETFGLVAIEAMSHGLPVIASRCGALKEIVEDAITGLLFQTGNVSELVSKIKLLWENPVLCKQLGTASRDKIINVYNEKNYFKRLMSIYRAAIEMNNKV